MDYSSFLRILSPEEVSKAFKDRDVFSIILLALFAAAIFACIISVTLGYSFHKLAILIVAMCFLAYPFSRGYSMVKNEEEKISKDTALERSNNKVDKPPSSFQLFEILRLIRLRPARSSGTTYTHKVRIVLKNISDRTLHIRRATFRQGNISIHIPPRLVFQIEASKGSWERDRWTNSAPPNNREVFVNRDGVFCTWIGLGENLDKDKVDRLHEARQLGTLVLTVDGYDERVEISI